jgi:DNA replication and repair protein RecF
LQEIGPLFSDIFTQITTEKSSSVDISVAYVAKGEDGPKNVDEIRNTLRKNLEQKWQTEMASGLSLYGPHKHDVVFYFDKKDSRHYCSQGQQRALILAFKFTQILYHRLIYGYYPILILDDVLSELDNEKKLFLINFLKTNEAQTFLTTTDLDNLQNFLENQEISVFSVKNGAIKDRWS